MGRRENRCSAVLQPVLGAALLSCAAGFDLTLVHWNDVHGRNTPATEGSQQLCLEDPYADPSCYGGHARIATVCKESKAANPSTLCIDAGDEFVGTTWDVLFRGQQNGPVLQEVGTDVMTVGNHEFDYGVSTLASFIDSVSFPFVGACNMDTSAEPSLNIQKWHVTTLDGKKVALLGYIAGDTGSLTSAGNVEFSDPLTAVPECLAEFKASPDSEGVDIVGLVSHAGLNVDREVAAMTTGVDFIVSAHSHTPMFPDLLGKCLELDDGACAAQDDSEVEYPLTVNGVPILQQFYASKYVGVATLTFDDAGTLTAATGESVPLGTYYTDAGEEIKVAEDAAVVALLEEGFQEVVALSQEVVGNLSAPLSAARPDIRIQEMPLGNVICDAMLSSLEQSGFQEEDGSPLVCLQNGGGIRADLPAGEVIFGDVTTVLPFGNVIEVLEISGATLKEALEWGYDSVEMVADPPGKYPHLGGDLSVVVDSSMPAGERILSLQHLCTSIEDTDVFHLATNDFLAGGGDGYTMLEPLERVLGFGPALDQALADSVAASVPAELLVTDGRYIDVVTGDVASATCPLDGGADAGVPSAAPTPAVADDGEDVDEVLVDDMPEGVYGGYGNYGN